MLVLQVKVGEAVVLTVEKPCTMKVVLTEYRRRPDLPPKIRIGFDAPETTKIFRQKVQDKIDQEAAADARQVRDQ
jgi:sRNA-binding carbon storage regulator CsrA